MSDRSGTALQLTLIRHAAAVHDRPGQGSDFDRVLSSAGERDVTRMADRLHGAGFAPDRIVTSTARRTRQTAEAIAARIGFPLEEIRGSADLYLASCGRLIECVSGTGGEVHHLALVGHNPGLSDLWEWLTGDDTALLPTCGVARFELDVASWAELTAGLARLTGFDHPGRQTDPAPDTRL